LQAIRTSGMFRLLCFLLFPVFSFAQSSLYAFRNVNIVDVESGRVLSGQSVIIKGNRIQKIGPRLSFPSGTRVIDASGKYLVPGLVDFNATVLNYESQAEPALTLLLANGITTVRDLQPRVPLTVGLQLKNEMLSGKRLGPRLLLISPLITTRGTREKKIVVQTPGQGQAALDSAVRQGAEVVKIDYTLSPPVMRAVIGRAKAYRIPVVAGISTSFIEAAEAGVSMIDHASDLRRVTTQNRQHYFDFYRNDSNKVVSREAFYNRVLPSLGEIDSVYFKQTIEVMRRNNTWLCLGPASYMPSVLKFEAGDSTRHIYKSARQLQALKKAKEDNEKIEGLERYKTVVEMKEIKWAYDLGLQMVAGSQMYEFMTPGFSLHDTFHWMQENGFRPLDILRTATINPARFMNRHKESGTIKKGKLADLVLVEENPLLDITNLRKIRAVVINGRLLQREDLDRLLKEVEEAVKAGK
jgi:imidazolonepropionase-like amidohydrolase